MDIDASTSSIVGDGCKARPWVMEEEAGPMRQQRKLGPNYESVNGIDDGWDTRVGNEAE